LVTVPDRCSFVKCTYHLCGC